ncbi:MAG: hypothetical protein TEF_21560 [Rhizobiales bacterium NRL2]|jgi:hypothetical protein|nr:MAG: hypothetical protein TEF_21560 [Rhizobiales bacterium NRL2]
MEKFAALLLVATPLALMILAWRMGTVSPLRRAMLLTGGALIAVLLYQLFVLGYVETESTLLVALLVLVLWCGILLFDPAAWVVWSLFVLATLLAAAVAWFLAFFRMTRLF